MGNLGETLWPAVKLAVLRYVIPTWFIMALSATMIQSWNGWLAAGAAAAVAVSGLAAYRLLVLNKLA